MPLRTTANLAVVPDTLPMRLGGAFACALLALACTNTKEQPNAKSPEKQSDAEYDLAVDLFRKGETRSALGHAQKAVSLNDENDKAHYLLAGIYTAFCTGPVGFEGPDCKLDTIEKHAREALKINPKFGDARNMLGQVLINEKKFKEAITIIEPLTKDPAYVHPFFAWGNLGWAQVQDGQIDLGITSLKNAVAEPRFCVGHYRLGVAYERKGDLGQAETSFSSAVGVSDPNCTGLQDAWEGRGRVRAKVGRVPDARKDYERCIEISKETQTGKACERELARLPAP